MEVSTNKTKQNKQDQRSIFIDDTELCFWLFGKREVKSVWEEKLKSDRSFIKINLMLTRIFFSMHVEADYFKDVKNARFEKLKKRV